MRKTTKKVLTTLAVCTAALSMAASVQASEKTKLIGMCWGSVDPYVNLTDAILADNSELAEKYEIEWVLGGQGDTDSAEKVRLALSANEYIADIVVLNYTQVPEFASAGVLTDLTDALAPYADVIPEGVKALTQYNGETIAVPWEAKSKVWYYRKDIFDECGIDVAEIKTMDDFIAAGQKIQETYPDSYIWNLGQTPCGYDFYMTLSGNGAAFCDADGNYNISQDAGVKAMLEDYKKAVDAGIVLDISDWTPDWEASLADGTLISQLCAGWLGLTQFLPTYAAGQEGLWACTTWPEIGGTVAGSDAGGSVLVVPSFSQNPEAAAEFAAYMGVSERANMCNFELGGALPLNKDAQATVVAEYADNAFFGTSYIEAQLTAMDTLQVFNYGPKADAETNIVLEYFKKAVYGEMSIDDALKQAEEDLNIMVGNAYN